MKVTILVMLPFYFGPVSPTIISTPENVALQRGTSTELICRVNSGSSVSSWTFTAYQSSGKDITIYSRAIGMVNNLTSFRKTTDKDGFLNIKTESAQPQDAGIYTCNIQLREDKGIRVVQRSAQLIVLDSDPSCTAIDYSTDGRKFKELSCSVGFRGNWAPVMEWREGGINGTVVTTGVQSNTSSNFVSHSLTIPVDDGEKTALSYTCVTFFSAYLGNVNATANNIPKYTFILPDKSKVSPVELPVPANAAVIKGANSTMVCKTSSTSTVYNWTFTAAGSSVPDVIWSQDNRINQKFRRHRYIDDSVSCLITIESTQLEDAGTYTCTKPAPASSSSGIVQESAQLIVLESDPKCSQEEQQEDINGHREMIFHLTCTVAFRGNWAPLMEWRFNDARGEIMEKSISKATAVNVTSSLRLVASSTRQNSKYICRTFFGNISSNVDGSAKNIPEYSYTWTSSVINESNDVSLVTLIVSLAVVVIAILVALIVYHMFFKRFLAGREPPAAAVVVMPSFQTVQESEYYAAIRETETSTGLSREQSIVERMPGTMQQQDISQSVAYGELRVNEDSPPHHYRKLPSASPSVQGSSELHPYANFPMLVDLPTPSADTIRPDGNIQQSVSV